MDVRGPKIQAQAVPVEPQGGSVSGVRSRTGPAWTSKTERITVFSVFGTHHSLVVQLNRQVIPIAEQ